MGYRYKCVDVDTDVAIWTVERRGFTVCSGTVEWYRSSCGIDFDDLEIASP